MLHKAPVAPHLQVHDALYYQHQKEMRTLFIIGILIVIAMLALSSSLIGLTFYAIRRGNQDIALVIGLFGVVSNIVTGALALMAPSPLQAINSARRAQDSGIIPTGTPKDPVSVEVADDATSNDAAKAEAEFNSTGDKL